MTERVLITGGAGFIGRRLAIRLRRDGWQVRILDNLLEQVHGPDAEFPPELARECECLRGDVTDALAMRSASVSVDAVVHLAAETGTAQSMYEMRRYADVNVVGMATVLDALIPHAARIRRVLLASTRAVYGEGRYVCGRCGPVFPELRSREQLERREWDPRCLGCAGSIQAVPTDESTPVRPVSIYGDTKSTQEQLLRTFGRSFHVDVTVLRYQNVFGAGQSLSNPYTGILTAFYRRIAQNQAPLVFEDGDESRDFVHVDDVVEATTRALTSSATRAGTFNVGSGVRTSIDELARVMVAEMRRTLTPVVTGQFRIGDIRHCFADIGRLTGALAWSPSVTLAAGVREFCAWAASQPFEADVEVRAERELKDRRLLGAS
ncbi:MAG: NAD-dependent epimerase/dehydratase family protein [Vicinamibacterales bacterium]